MLWFSLANLAQMKFEVMSRGITNSDPLLVIFGIENPRLNVFCVSEFYTIDEHISREEYDHLIIQCTLAHHCHRMSSALDTNQYTRHLDDFEHCFNELMMMMMLMIIFNVVQCRHGISRK